MRPASPVQRPPSRLYFRNIYKAASVGRIHFCSMGFSKSHAIYKLQMTLPNSSGHHMKFMSIFRANMKMRWCGKKMRVLGHGWREPPMYLVRNGWGRGAFAGFFFAQSLPEIYHIAPWNEWQAYGKNLFRTCHTLAWLWIHTKWKCQLFDTCWSRRLFSGFGCLDWKTKCSRCSKLWSSPPNHSESGRYRLRC